MPYADYSHRTLQMQQGQRSPNGDSLSSPDEFQFTLSDEDLETSNRQELSRLNKELKEAQQQFDKLKIPG